MKTLCCWPSLPIIIQYGGSPNLDPPAPEDDDNIIAALEQSGRVSSIGLTVTSSLLGKLSAISEPLSELEELLFYPYIAYHCHSRALLGGALASVLSTRPALPILHFRDCFFPLKTSLIFSSTKFLVLGIFLRKFSRMPCRG